MASELLSGGLKRSAESGVTANADNVDGGDEGVGGATPSKPNVFFFLIDDMGYGDIGYQSTDLSELTPNLDALAAGGVKVGRYLLTLF
eukprot:g15167.t1